VYSVGAVLVESLSDGMVVVAAIDVAASVSVVSPLALLGAHWCFLRALGMSLN